MDFIDIYQNKKISDAHGASERAVGKAERFGEELRNLERRLEKLILVNQALWELLKEAGQMTEEHLNYKVSQLEAEAAAATGPKNVMNCPKCSRPTMSKRTTCMYCGTALPEGTVFEKI